MSETVKSVKIPTPRKFSYTPKNEDEKKYLESLMELLKDKRTGDWVIISEKLKISRTSAERAFFRVYQKNHFEVVEALRMIIENRNNLIKQDQ